MKIKTSVSNYFVRARLGLFMSKCHIVGNHMSRLNYSYVFTDAGGGSWDNAPISKIHVNNDAELVVWDIRATCNVMTTCSRQKSHAYEEWTWVDFLYYTTVTRQR